MLNALQENGNNLKMLMIMKGNGEMDLIFGGKAHSMIVDEKGNSEAAKVAVQEHNKAVNTYREALERKTQEELEYAKEITKKMESLELIPINSYVLVKPYAKNPFEKLEVTDSGIFLPTYTGGFRNPDTGEDDKEVNLSVQAQVIEASPDCKYVKEGDVVYYRRVSGVPIPFFGQGLEVVAEQQIQVVINEKLKERFKMNKND